MKTRDPSSTVRDAHALLVQGVEELEQDHIDEAISLLRQSAELNRELFQGQLALGMALTKAFEMLEAEAALDNAIRLEPQNFWAHLRKAELHHRQGGRSKAEEELRTAMRLADSAEKKMMAHELLVAEKRYTARPDFTRLMGRKTKRWL